MPKISELPLQIAPIGPDTIAVVSDGVTSRSPLSSLPVSVNQQAALDAKQPLDATLTALSGVDATVNKLPYFTGTDTASTTTFSPFARTLVDDSDSATARQTLGAAGSGSNSDITQLLALTSIGGGSVAGFRNRVINGGMRVAQRGNATVTNNVTRLFGGCDRFPITTSGFSALSATLQQASFGTEQTSTGFFQWLGITSATASTTNSGVISFDHRIEALNCGLVTGSYTASAFVVGGTITGTPVVKIGLYKPTTTADTFSALTLLAESVPVGVTVSGSRISVTTTLTGAQASLGLEVRITISGINGGTSTAVGIGDVQFEAGSVATSFELRPHGLELSLCQRYYEKSYETSVTTLAGAHQAIASTGALLTAGTVRYTTPKRVAATVVQISPIDGAAGVVGEYNTSTVAVTNRTATVSAGNSSSFFTVTTGATIGNQLFFHWTASAEL